MSKQIIPAIVGLIILAGLGWYIDSHLHDDIVWTIRAALYAFIASLALALVGISLFSVLMFRESFLRQVARRKLAQREADVMTIESDTHGVFIRDMNPRAAWRPLHLVPNQYQNGRPAPATPEEVTNWATWQTLRAPRVINHPPQQAAPALLPALLPGPVDLLAALDSIQRGLIVGPSDSGKTTLLRWVIARRLTVSSVVILDPHAYPGKWPDGVIVIGAGRAYDDIDRALTALVRLMTKRYQDIGQGVVAEMGHKRIAVIIDEWRAIAYNVKGSSEAIKTLLTESRKAAFSMFVASHSERVKALGIEGEGDLKDGFAIVRLSNVGGNRQATLDLGSGEQPVTLPGPFGNPVTRIGSGDDFTLEIEPDQEESKILELHDSGESVSAIAAKVYGSKGGKQNDKVRAKLERFGRV